MASHPDHLHRREQLTVRGLVQGVGFRPFVFRLAQSLGLTGSVCNSSSGVTIEVQGTAAQLDEFRRQLRESAPPLARMDAVDCREVEPVRGSGFLIVESQLQGAGMTSVAPDVGLCGACLADIRDPSNRRFRHAFASCTHCGPRYTMIREMPYDREATTMSAFPMCEDCRREYRDPADRRYHAQPICCPRCGPRVWFLATGELTEGNGADEQTVARVECPGGLLDEAAIAAFHLAIARGEIVAVKGLGGFHLACAADDGAAVDRLRARKGRGDKPLAVLVADLSLARRLVHLSAEEARWLSGPERPIVLLRKRASGKVAEGVAPGNRELGVMLPYTPLHWLLAERRPLVMTSGNLSEAPLARTNREAVERLGAIADAFLLHDREIQSVCDDSVVRVHRGTCLPIRRARGLAPAPISLPISLPIDLLAGVRADRLARGRHRTSGGRARPAGCGGRPEVDLLRDACPGGRAQPAHR